MMTNKTNKAFTLIEVLVVTAVISLVASIANAQLGEARDKADDAHMKTEVQQVRNAVEQYRQKTGTVPLAPSGSSYTAGNMVREDSDEYKEVMQQLVAEDLMPEVPSSPNGQSYSYLATTDGEEAVFAATLNNEDPGSNANSCEVIEQADSYTVEPDFIEAEFVAIGDCGGTDCYSITEVAYWSDENNGGQVATPVGYTCQIQEEGEIYSPCNELYDKADDYSEIEYCNNNYVQRVHVCTEEGDVCSGSSNSDYCSCI